MYCGNQFVKFQLRLEQISLNEMDLEVHYSKIFIISVLPKLLIGVVKHTITDVPSVANPTTLTYLIFDLSSYFPCLFHANNKNGTRHLDERALNLLPQRSHSFYEQPSRASKLSTWSLYELSNSTVPIFSFSPSYNIPSFSSGPQISSQPSTQSVSRSHVMLNRRAFSFSTASVESTMPYFTRQFVEVTLQETLCHMVEAIELPHHFAIDLAVDISAHDYNSSHLHSGGDIPLLPSLSSVRAVGRHLIGAEHTISQLKNICPLSYAIPNSPDRTSHTLIVSMDCDYCRFPSLVCVPASRYQDKLRKLRTYNCLGQGCQFCTSLTPHITRLSTVALNVDEQISNFDERLPILSHLIVVESRKQGDRIFVYYMLIVKGPEGDVVGETDEKGKATSGDSDDAKEECDSVWKDVGDSNAEIDVSDDDVNHTSNERVDTACQGSRMSK